MSASKPTQGELASAFLRELGAPDTQPMRLAVIAWMRAESGSTIIGNNPWNLRPGADDAAYRSGTRTSINGNGQFSVYPTAQAGAAAAAHRLVAAGHDWRAYDVPVKAARKGDPIGFLNGIAHSAWDASRYGTKSGPNKLLGIYAGLGGNVTNAELTYISTTGSKDPQAGGAAISASVPTIGQLGGWNNIVVFPTGHILTASDIDYIMAQLAANGYFTSDSTGAAQSVTRAILASKIGKPWDKPLQDQLQKEFGSAANNATFKPLDALGSIAGSVTQVLAALFDPRKWLLFLALIAGAGLTAYGGTNVLAAAR